MKASKFVNRSLIIDSDQMRIDNLRASLSSNLYHIDGYSVPFNETGGNWGKGFYGIESDYKNLISSKIST